MYSVIKKLSGKVTEVNCLCIRLWFYLVYEIDERRLRIALKTVGYRCNVDKIVRLKNDELRHKYLSVFIPSHTHEIKLSAFP